MTIATRIEVNTFEDLVVAVSLLRGVEAEVLTIETIGVYSMELGLVRDDYSSDTITAWFDRDVGGQTTFLVDTMSDEVIARNVFYAYTERKAETRA